MQRRVHNLDLLSYWVLPFVLTDLKQGQLQGTMRDNGPLIRIMFRIHLGLHTSPSSRTPTLGLAAWCRAMATWGAVL